MIVLCERLLLLDRLHPKVLLFVFLFVTVAGFRSFPLDIQGEWLDFESEHIFVFEDDSRWSLIHRGRAVGTGQWDLAGNELTLTGTPLTFPAFEVSMDEGALVMTADGQNMRMHSLNGLTIEDLHGPWQNELPGYRLYLDRDGGFCLGFGLQFDSDGEVIGEPQVNRGESTPDSVGQWELTDDSRLSLSGFSSESLLSILNDGKHDLLFRAASVNGGLVLLRENLSIFGRYTRP